MLGDPLVPVYDSIINDQNLLFFAIGGFLVFFALISLFVKERLYLSEAFVSVLFGILIGPACLDIFNPYKIVDHNAIATVESTNITHFGSLEKFTLEVSRIIIGIQVMAVGIALPKNYIW
jgi:sodium/hydrogen antiporter